MGRERKSAQSENLPREDFVWLNLHAEPKDGYALEDVAAHIARLWSSDLSDDHRHRSHVMHDAGHKTIELAVPLELVRPELGLPSCSMF
jgi:hypothetical protein